MRVEVIALIVLCSLLLYFMGLLYLQWARRPFSLKVPGYKHYFEHDPFRHHITKNYHGLSLSFYPLVDSHIILGSSQKNQAHFHGFVCQLEVTRIERELFEKITENFDRFEEGNNSDLALYKEEIEFNTPEMQSFVQQLDHTITKYLEHHNQVVV